MQRQKTHSRGPQRNLAWQKPSRCPRGFGSCNIPHSLMILMVAVPGCQGPRALIWLCSWANTGACWHNTWPCLVSLNPASCKHWLMAQYPPVSHLAPLVWCLINHKSLLFPHEVKVQLECHGKLDIVDFGNLKYEDVNKNLQRTISCGNHVLKQFLLRSWWTIFNIYPVQVSFKKFWNFGTLLMGKSFAANKNYYYKEILL